MKSLFLSLIAGFAASISFAGVGHAQECNDCTVCDCENSCNCKQRFNHGGVRCAGGNCSDGKTGPALTRTARHQRRALAYPWHCNYYHAEWGSPVALVVPPTAERQYNMGWGVANSRATRIWHQFGRAYPGEFVGGDDRQFLPTPRWPSDTSQFGVYYVRGPW
jgi:hypothetical protein